MRNDQARHLVEADLVRRGWTIYRLGLGEGPALVARSGHDLVDVAVASAIETGGRVYPPSSVRTRGAAVLAYVASDESVRYLDPQGRLDGLRGVGRDEDPRDGPEAALTGAAAG